MDKPVELIPLTCMRCSTPLPAAVDEVAWVCAQCGQGMVLEADHGLAPLVVHYAAGIGPGSPGRPFWVANGQVSLARETYKGNENDDARAFWNAPRRFFIPAFSSPQETLLATGTQMLLQPPQVTEGAAVPFLPVNFTREDAAALAEFIVLAIEAGRRDMLKKVQFDLKLSPLELWIIP